MSHHDWTQICRADAATRDNCPLPVARAFDHQDNVVDVTTTAYVIDLDMGLAYGSATAGAYELDDAESGDGSFGIFDNEALAGKRASYLFKYDARDAAGNKADQVVFGLLMNDVEAPDITSCYMQTPNTMGFQTIEIEAGSVVTPDAAESESGLHGLLCNPSAVKFPVPSVGNQDPLSDDISWTPEYSDTRPNGQLPIQPSAARWEFTAEDNIDSEDLLTFTAQVYQCHASQSAYNAEPCENDPNWAACADLPDNIFTDLDYASLEVTAATYSDLGSKIVRVNVADGAGVYGADQEDNVGQYCMEVRVSDNEPPLLVPLGQDVEFAECCSGSAAVSEWATLPFGSGSIDESAFAGCDSSHHVDSAQNPYTPFSEKRVRALDAFEQTYEWNHDHVQMGSFIPAGASTPLVSDAVATGSSYTVDFSAVTESGSHKHIYHLAYDASGNTAIYAATNTPFYEREIHVVDRTAPILRLDGSDIVVIGSNNTHVDAHFNGSHAAFVDGLDPGTIAWDMCKAQADLITTSRWVKDQDPGDLKVMGTYTRAYKVCDRAFDDACDGTETWAENQHCCMDEHGMAVQCCSAEQFRTFEVVDDEAPTLSTMGTPEVHIAASKHSEYADAGATCVDYQDGILSHAVEISGQVVSLRDPGTYTVRYDCVDLVGHAAAPAFRTVIVEDNECPEIELLGHPEISVEAGFAYEDAGFNANDDLDGDLTVIGPYLEGTKGGCKVDGRVETTADASWISAKSCADVKTLCDNDAALGPCTTGQYHITAFDKTRRSFQRVPVWCEMDLAVPLTVYEVADGTPITLGSTEDAAGDNSCTNLGMVMTVYSFLDEEESDYRQVLQDKYCVGAADNCLFFPTVLDGETSQYLCHTVDDATQAHEAAFAPPLDDHAQSGHLAATAGNPVAVPGTYYLVYTCMDNSDNRDCAWAQSTEDDDRRVTRTVNVRDTFAPVITLHGVVPGHDGSRVVAQSAEYNHETDNPAASPKYNPFLRDGLMAESSTFAANGWLVGALAAATTGLALFALKTYRATTYVAVPV
jgi:hypothetical protein